MREPNDLTLDLIEDILASGLTVNALAYLAGVSKSTISRLRNKQVYLVQAGVEAKIRKALKEA
jgi:transcriptional regulator with XRE-family HTH domain